jgi:hypothetical protein
MNLVRNLRLATLLGLGAVSLAAASSPVLYNIQPRGGQLGTEVEITLQGERLEDTKELFIYDPGVTVVAPFKVVNGNAVTTKVKIAADCPIGEKRIRVRTASGITELKTFWVGSFPTVVEKEPNNEFSAPQPVPINSTVAGVVDYEDVDHFIVEAKKGQRISAEAEAIRLGIALFDINVAILNEKRFELSQNDDTALLARDAYASVIAPADGKYIIRVRESSNGGNGAFQYRLHIGTFPRPTAVYPAGGKEGDEVELTYIGDVSGPIKEKIKLQAFGGERMPIHAKDPNGVAPAANWIRVSKFPNHLELEPNDSFDKATPAPVPAPLALNGIIEKDGDTDVFRVKMGKGQAFDVHVYARRLRSGLDPVLEIYNSKGGGLGGNDDAIGPDSYMRFQAPEDGEYLILVRDHLRKGQPDFVYRVELQPVEATMQVMIPQVAVYSQERQTIPVPKNGRYASLIQVNRANFGGELSIFAPQLPPGVKLVCDNMPANLGIIPMVFEADGTANPGGVLAPILAKHVDPKLNFPAKFTQPVQLVNEGQNYAPYYVTEVDRAAIAVTDELPFKVNIVEPKAPLVRDGNLNLKIVAERKPGYKAPINLFNIFNPPGVGSGYMVTIPEGQNEVLYPLNANGGAEPKKWKMTFIAQANVGNGPIWTATQLGTVEVTEHQVTGQVERAAVEQGKGTDVVVKLTVAKPFEGEAIIRLVGLPGNCSAPELKMTKDTKEVVFKVATTAQAPVGQHGNLFCQVIMKRGGDEYVQNAAYGGVLRIDAPPPPKKDEPKPAMPAAAAAPAPAPKAEPKRLSRLEQLRLEQAEKAKKGM